MGKLIDLTGQKFGRLTVLRCTGRDSSRHALWLCRCNCGTETIVVSFDIKSGHTKSCGCLRSDVSRVLNVTHGHTSMGKISKTWTTWCGMVQRCTDIRYKQYKDYGGRGITICEQWRKFENFLKDMGEVPEGYQIDRIDNDKGYCKSNCRWATKQQQMRNTRVNHLITYEGETQCLAAWAEKYEMNAGTLKSRLRLGWSAERAFTTPVKKRQSGTLSE